MQKFIACLLLALAAGCSTNGKINEVFSLSPLGCKDGYQCTLIERQLIKDEEGSQSYIVSRTPLAVLAFPVQQLTLDEQCEQQSPMGRSWKLQADTFKRQVIIKADQDSLWLNKTQISFRNGDLIQLRLAPTGELNSSQIQLPDEVLSAAAQYYDINKLVDTISKISPNWQQQKH